MMRVHKKRWRTSCLLNVETANITVVYVNMPPYGFSLRRNTGTYTHTQTHKVPLWFVKRNVPKSIRNIYVCVWYKTTHVVIQCTIYMDARIITNRHYNNIARALWMKQLGPSFCSCQLHKKKHDHIINGHIVWVLLYIPICPFCEQTHTHKSI